MIVCRRHVCNKDILEVALLEARAAREVSFDELVDFEGLGWYL